MTMTWEVFSCIKHYISSKQNILQLTIFKSLSPTQNIGSDPVVCACLSQKSSRIVSKERSHRQFFFFHQPIHEYFIYEFFPLFRRFQLHQSEWHVSYQFIFVSDARCSCKYTYLKIDCPCGEGAILVYQQIIFQMARFSKKKT